MVTEKPRQPFPPDLPSQMVKRVNLDLRPTGRLRLWGISDKYYLS
jgi:hypothetical protein